MNEEELKRKYGTNNLGNPDIDEDDFMSEEDKIMEEIKLYEKDKNYPIIERIQSIIQKGKLEQKKEEFAFLNGVLKLPEVWALVVAKRLKQLQKEIGEEKECLK